MANRSILWTFMFRVASQRQARARLAMAEKLLDRPLPVTGCERYWKIPALWTCAAATPLRGRTTAAQLRDCCDQAFLLAYGWHFSGYDAGVKVLHGFEGVFAAGSGSHACVQDLEWASLSLEAP